MREAAAAWALSRAQQHSQFIAEGRKFITTLWLTIILQVVVRSI